MESLEAEIRKRTLQYPIIHNDVYQRYTEFFKNTIRISDYEKPVAWELIDKEFPDDKLPIEKYYLFKCGRDKYLAPEMIEFKDGIKRDVIMALPIIIQETREMIFRGDIYKLVVAADTIKIQPKMFFSPGELTDRICPNEHTNMIHQVLLKHMALGAYIFRSNTRICSPAQFGKGSVIDTIGALRFNVICYKPRSVPSLLYHLQGSKLMGLDEVCGMKEDRDIDALREFLLQAGAFKNTYTRPTKNMTGGPETFNISKLSLMLFYNRYCDYADPSRYFDLVMDNQVKSRVPPFKLEGMITQYFKDPVDLEAEFESHRKLLIKMSMTIEYYIQNFNKHFHNWKRSFDLTRGKMSRWVRSYEKTLWWMDMCCESQEEFTELEHELLGCHYKYFNMFEADTLDKYNSDRIDTLVCVGEVPPPVEEEELFSEFTKKEQTNIEWSN